MCKSRETFYPVDSFCMMETSLVPRRPAPQHTDPHGLSAFIKRTIREIHVDRRVVGRSVGRHVDHPCGGQISSWPARKVTNPRVSEGFPKAFWLRLTCTRTLQRPLQRPPQKPFRNPSGIRGFCGRNKSLNSRAPDAFKNIVSLRAKGTPISEPRFSTPCEMRFFPREKGKKAILSGPFQRKGRFAFLAWEKSHLAGGGKLGLTS